VTTANGTSVIRVFETLQNLELASSLKINHSKTCCLHTAKHTNANLLPQIRWEKYSLHILGSCIGSHESIGSIWDKCVKNITATAKYFSTFFLTWNAKSLIVKSKMLPLATYNAIPTKTRQKINRTIEQFIAGHRDITIPANTLAQPFGSTQQFSLVAAATRNYVIEPLLLVLSTPGFPARGGHPVTAGTFLCGEIFFIFRFNLQ